jgi:hypothetical protein
MSTGNTSYVDVNQRYKSKVIHLKSNRIKVTLPSLGCVMFAKFDESVVQLKPSKEMQLPSKVHYRYAFMR